jgi:hypothetical protein
MKKLGAASFGMLFFLGVGTAQAAGSSAAGTYRFVMEDRVTKPLDFSVSKDERGRVTGQMRYLDPVPVPDTDAAEDPRPVVPPEFSITVTFDSLTVERNGAVMNGTIRESSHGSYVGKWVQLVVEDNGADPRVPDRLTWSFCKPRSGSWVPSDAELPDDDGAYLSWWSTDAERRDDVGIPSPNLLPVDERSCPDHPFTFYSFADVLEGSGDIVVQP